MGIISIGVGANHLRDSASCRFLSISAIRSDPKNNRSENNAPININSELSFLIIDRPSLTGRTENTNSTGVARTQKTSTESCIRTEPDDMFHTRQPSCNGSVLPPAQMTFPTTAYGPIPTKLIRMYGFCRPQAIDILQCRT